MPILAGNDIAICNSWIENTLEQPFSPSRSRRSLARVNKRRIPDFCSFQPTDQPVVAPQNLEEGAKPNPLAPSSEVPEHWLPGKSPKESPRESLPARPKEPWEGTATAEELRRLIYLFPGTDGVPNSDVCSIPTKPMHKVPICAPPHPTRDSFADTVSPARFCEFLFPVLSYPPLQNTSHIEWTDSSSLRRLEIRLSTISEMKRLKVPRKPLPQI